VIVSTGHSVQLKALPLQSMLHPQYWGEFYKIRQTRGGFMNNMKRSSDGDIMVKSVNQDLILFANLNQCRRSLRIAYQDCLREVLVKIKRTEEHILSFRSINVLYESGSC
jgi:hypothetical protein